MRKLILIVLLGYSFSQPNVADLELHVEPNTLIINDLPSYIDTTETITELNLQAIVKDNNGVGIENIPVDF